MSHFLCIYLAAHHSPKKSQITSAGRPPAVSLWIKNGRRNRIKLTDREHHQYKEQWVAWWDTYNPAWRTRRDGRLAQEGAGDWSAMLHAGSNGYVNILVGLLGYHEVASDEDLGGGILNA